MGPEVLCPDSECRLWSPVDDRTAHCRYCGASYRQLDVNVPRLCALNRLAHDELIGLYARCLLGLALTVCAGWFAIGLTGNLLATVLMSATSGGVIAWGVRTWLRYVRPAHPEVFGAASFRYGIPLPVPRT
ncbi:MAG TPA: hypothetical protein VD862_03625 [Candidatus Paceibacterota bacterium]|nr:hypothetical protein [Candidatus Paceibacterota bacterium]